MLIISISMHANIVCYKIIPIYIYLLKLAIEDFDNYKTIVCLNILN